MKKFIQYEHHGVDAWVREDLKGKHRDHCLCFSCGRFKPNSEDNCATADLLFAVCKRCGLVTPVYECPFFYELPQ